MQPVTRIHADQEVKVELTSNDLMQSQQALTRLGNCPLAPKAAYWVGKTLKKVQNKSIAVSKALDKSRRDLIISMGKEVMEDSKVVGEPAKATGNFEVLAERQEEFNAAWQAKLDEVVEVEMQQICLSVFGDTKLMPNDMAALLWLLVDDIAWS